MAYRRRRRSGNGKYRTCKRYKYVRVKGQGRARRCADYTVHRKPSRRRKRRSSGYRRRKPAGMARRGSKCMRMKRVRAPGIRGRKTVLRCAKYR
jgi:hypothetical protein